jgi:hypothetical protein
VDNLGRVADAELEYVAIFFGLGVEAKGLMILFTHLARYNGTVDASVLGDLVHRKAARSGKSAGPVLRCRPSSQHTSAAKYARAIHS